MNLMFAKTHLKDFVIVILREGLFLYVNQLNMNPLNTWCKKVVKMTASMYMMKYDIATVFVMSPFKAGLGLAGPWTRKSQLTALSHHFSRCMVNMKY